MSILHWVAPLKVSFRTITKRFWLTSVQGWLYMKTTTLKLKLIYFFINFIIPLPLTHVRHDVTAKDWQNVCLSKYRELLEVNDTFKLLPRQLNYQRLYSWNLIATSAANSCMKELFQTLIASIISVLFCFLLVLSRVIIAQ